MSFLHLICDSLPIELQLAKRFVKFMYQTMSNNNQVLTLCGRLALVGSMSPVGNNSSFMSQLLKYIRYNIPNSDTVSYIYDCENNKCVHTVEVINPRKDYMSVESGLARIINFPKSPLHQSQHTFSWHYHYINSHTSPFPSLARSSQT